MGIEKTTTFFSLQREWREVKTIPFENMLRCTVPNAEVPTTTFEGSIPNVPYLRNYFKDDSSSDESD